MASYWKYTSTGTNYWITLVVENVNQDITNNRSKVRYKAYITGASGTSSWGTGSYTVSINGAQTSGSVQYDFSSSKTWYCVGSASAYVTSGYINHNNDGTKSINVSFSFSGASYVGNATISETFTLDQIPRNELAFVKISTGWKKGKVYVKTSNGWKEGKKVYVKTSTGWKESSLKG